MLVAILRPATRPKVSAGVILIPPIPITGPRPPAQSPTANRFEIASPYTLAHSASTAKVAPTTVASGYGSLVTEATTARLTYTSPATAVVKLDYDVSIKQASGADRDIVIAVHRNGSVIAGSEVIMTSVTGDAHQASGSCLYNASTNDYFEIYALNTGASGDMLFQKVGLTLTAT